MDSAKWLERELAVEKENTTAMEAKLWKKKMLNKVSITEFKKKLGAAEWSLKSVIAWVDAIEKKKEQAEAAAKEVVEACKNSDAFRVEVTEASIDSYLFGYDDCLAKVAQLFPDLDLSRLLDDAKEDVEEGEIPIDAREDDQSAQVEEVSSPAIAPEE